MPARDRTRSFEHIEHMLRAAGGIEAAARMLLARRAPIDVLEVGFGHGRALLELAWRLRDADVRFHGVDIGYKSPIKAREDLRAIAREHDIVPAAEIDAFELPQIDFYDATRLRFDDGSMDLIYSAVTIRFMRDKALFLEEACRVLRPGGHAILHIGENHWNYPPGKVSDERVLTPYTSRMVLKHGDELIPLPAYLKLFEGEAFRFELTTQSRCILIVDKLAPGKLALDLDYNDELSMAGRKLPLRGHKGDIRGGFRTVYDVKTSMHQRLRANGLMSPA